MHVKSLASIFESREKFTLQHFNADEKSYLEAYISERKVFKKRRMLDLLQNNSAPTQLTWIEWFNWYYQGVAFNDFPLWLEEAKSKLNIRELCLNDYPTLLSKGWEIKDVVKASIDISTQGIGNYKPSENELAHWINLRSKNTDLFTGALLAGELVGQLGFIKISAYEYKAMSDGELSEEHLSGSIQENEDIYLYIPSVVIKQALQNKRLLLPMLKHLFAQFDNSPMNNNVKGFIAIAFTVQGEKLCKQFNLTYKPSSNLDQKIYCGERNSLLQSRLFISLQKSIHG